MKKPTPSCIKYNYEINNPTGKWFSRENMKFAGDTMSGFSVGVLVDYDGGQCWPLFRKKNQFKPCAFFDSATWKIVRPTTHPWSEQ